ncbi:MAG: hypothetical protein H7A53_05960 [Akkermansiaceae bacterium]|nr:hypothetical protein [Akkermansiaceae bacterium]
MTARENPFAAGRLAERLPFEPAWLGLDWDRVFRRGEEAAWRVAVCGPHGTGKTTFLDALTPRLEAAGYRVLRRLINDAKPALDSGDWEEIRAFEAPGVVTIDGSERLGSWTLGRLARAAKGRFGLILTRHRTRGPLPVLLETKSDAVMLAAFLERLAPQAPWDPRFVESLLARHGGNLREALWECYDRHAALKAPTSRPFP